MSEPAVRFTNTDLAAAVSARRPPAEVVDLLLAGQVLVPVAATEDGPHLVTVVGEDGTVAVPTYTSAESFGLSGRQSCAVVTGRYVADVGRSLNATAVLLDPESPAAAAVPLEWITARQAERGAPLPGGQVAIGAPAKAPSDELVAAVRAAVRATTGVKAGYLFQIAGDGSVARLVVGTELEQGIDPAAVMPTFVARLGREIPEGAGIDVMPLNEEMLEGVAAAVEAIL